MEATKTNGPWAGHSVVEARVQPSGIILSLGQSLATANRWWLNVGLMICVIFLGWDFWLSDGWIQQSWAKLSIEPAWKVAMGAGEYLLSLFVAVVAIGLVALIAWSTSFALHDLDRGTKDDYYFARVAMRIVEQKSTFRSLKWKRHLLLGLVAFLVMWAVRYAVEPCSVQNNPCSATFVAITRTAGAIVLAAAAMAVHVILSANEKAAELTKRHANVAFRKPMMDSFFDSKKQHESRGMNELAAALRLGGGGTSTESDQIANRMYGAMQGAIEQEFSPRRYLLGAGIVSIISLVLVLMIVFAHPMSELLADFNGGYNWKDWTYTPLAPYVKYFAAAGVILVSGMPDRLSNSFVVGERKPVTTAQSVRQGKWIRPVCFLVLFAVFLYVFDQIAIDHVVWALVGMLIAHCAATVVLLIPKCEDGWNRLMGVIGLVVVLIALVVALRELCMSDSCLSTHSLDSIKRPRIWLLLFGGCAAFILSMKDVTEQYQSYRCLAILPIAILLGINLMEISPELYSTQAKILLVYCSIATVALAPRFDRAWALTVKKFRDEYTEFLHPATLYLVVALIVAIGLIAVTVIIVSVIYLASSAVGWKWESVVAVLPSIVFTWFAFVSIPWLRLCYAMLALATLFGLPILLMDDPGAAVGLLDGITPLYGLMLTAVVMVALPGLGSDRRRCLIFFGFFVVLCTALALRDDGTLPRFHLGVGVMVGIIAAVAISEFRAIRYWISGCVACALLLLAIWGIAELVVVALYFPMPVDLSQRINDLLAEVPNQDGSQAMESIVQLIQDAVREYLVLRTSGEANIGQVPVVPDELIDFPFLSGVFGDSWVARLPKPYDLVYSPQIAALLFVGWRVMDVLVGNLHHARSSFLKVHEHFLIRNKALGNGP